MIRAKEIQDKLLHLVGWQRDFNEKALQPADSLLESESGLYFNQMHPLLTLKNLNSIMPEYAEDEYGNYPEYIESVTYKKGDIISYRFYADEGWDSPFELIKLFRVISDTTLSPISLWSVEPNKPKSFSYTIRSSYWEEITPFTLWLEEKTKASIAKVISHFMSDKMQNGAAKAIIENKALFDGTGRIVDTIKNRNKVAGFEIVPIRSDGIVTKINRIGFQATKAGVYTFYLYHSSSLEPIRVITINKTKANTFEWFSFSDLFLRYDDESLDVGGSWYLVYKQSDLTAMDSEAIRKDRDWSKGPCASCNRREYLSWQAWSRYLEIHPFVVSEDEVVDNQLWDIQQNIYDYTTNFGLNLDVSVYCDISDFIINQRAEFATVLSKQLAVDMLREFVYNANVRTNRHSINASKADIIFDLEGDTASLHKSGLSYELELAYKAIAFDTKGINRICLPCINNGIKYRGI